jgi:hypothetical protein
MGKAVAEATMTVMKWLLQKDNEMREYREGASRFKQVLWKLLRELLDHETVM